MLTFILILIIAIIPIYLVYQLVWVGMFKDSEGFWDFVARFIGIAFGTWLFFKLISLIF